MAKLPRMDELRKMCAAICDAHYSGERYGGQIISALGPCDACVICVFSPAAAAATAAGQLSLNLRQLHKCPGPFALLTFRIIRCGRVDWRRWRPRQRRRSVRVCVRAKINLCLSMRLHVRDLPVANRANHTTSTHSTGRRRCRRS